MAIVNFAVPKNLDQRVNKVIKEKGFGSKAEFYRSAAIYFIDGLQQHSFVNEEARFNYLADAVSKKLSKKYGGKKLPSIDEQLADL
jgi:metal-responsive CopG/Arc/MetJ family transcriptional regulator